MRNLLPLRFCLTLRASLVQISPSKIQGWPVAFRQFVPNENANRWYLSLAFFDGICALGILGGGAYLIEMWNRHRFQIVRAVFKSSFRFHLSSLIGATWVAGLLLWANLHWYPTGDFIGQEAKTQYGMGWPEPIYFCTLDPYRTYTIIGDGYLQEMQFRTAILVDMITAGILLFVSIRLFELYANRFQLRTGKD